MDGGGREPLEGAEDLGTDGKDTGTGGRQPTAIYGVLQGSGTYGSPIWVRDVGDDPLHGQVPYNVPPHGCQAEMVVPTDGDSNGGGGVWGERSICPEEA